MIYNLCEAILITHVARPLCLCPRVDRRTDRQPFIRPGDGEQLWGETNLAVRPASVTERPHERSWQHSFRPGLGQQEYVYVRVCACVCPSECVCKCASCPRLFYGCLWKQEVMTSFHMVYMRPGWPANTEPYCRFKWFQLFCFFSLPPCEKTASHLTEDMQEVAAVRPLVVTVW